MITRQQSLFPEVMTRFRKYFLSVSLRTRSVHLLMSTSISSLSRYISLLAQ